MSEQPQFAWSVDGDALDLRVTLALDDKLLTEDQRELLRVLWGHKGAGRAVRAQEILDQLHKVDDERARRWVKGTVEDLVVRLGVPIGGLRTPPYGYFLIESAGDLDLAIGPLWSEVYSHLRRLRSLTSKSDVAKLFGQAMLKLDGDKEAA
jgi:hypothetical protein